MSHETPASLENDGMRAGVTAAGARWRVRTRTGLDATSAFPELTVLPDLLAGRRVALDGELVVLDPSGAPDFARLQRRIGVRAPSRQLLRAAPVSLYVFDLLVLDDQDLTAATYTERRAMLEDSHLRGPGVDTPPCFIDAAAEVYLAANERNLKGVVCKRLTSTYLPGQRSKAWIKTVSVGQHPVSVPDFSSSRRHRAQPFVRDTCCGGREKLQRS